MKKITKNGKTVRLYTFDEVFKKSSKSKEFRRAYQLEDARISLARAIRTARAQKRLTQATIAKRAGMPQSVIARLESGVHGVSVETLSRVAHALGKKIQLV